MPSPHHKSGPWLYGLATATPAPRSYIVESPAGLTKRNRAHLRPAAPPHPGALIYQSHANCGALGASATYSASCSTCPSTFNPTSSTTIHSPALHSTSCATCSSALHYTCSTTILPQNCWCGILLWKQLRTSPWLTH